MEKAIYTRPPLAILACTNPECEWYGKQNQGNLRVRKVYGRDQIRYLRCATCKEEFSERKGTALWNCKIDEERAIAVAEHLGEGCSFKSTVRLVRVDPDTVRRLNRVLGQHGRLFHDERAQELVAHSLQADERHGFVTNKRTPSWEAEIIDPASKFVLSHVQGQKDLAMIRRLLEDGANRLSHRHHVALFTDGEPAYATLFPEIFGVPYRRYRHNNRGRPPEIRYRVPRSLAHVQIIKKRMKQRLQSVTVNYRHGSKKRAQEALYTLRHAVPNTAINERRNGTVRCMNASQTRRTLAFSRHPAAKLALGWWTLTVYNWCRTHRMLKEPLRRPTFSKKYVRIRLCVRRYRCLTRSCAKQTFSQLVPSLMQPYQRVTNRLLTSLYHIAQAAGSQAGVRLAHKLAMLNSGSTMLRIIRRHPEGYWSAPSVLGVDD